MKVRSGWNSEFARKKYDVELDEADLARILTANAIPLEAQLGLSLEEAHALLYLSAEIKARQTMARYVKTDKDLVAELKTEARQLATERQSVIVRIWNRLGLKQEGAEVDHPG